MAGPFDFTGQNIEDSYQRVLQTDGASIYDGTGSLFSLPSAFPYTGSARITGSLGVTGSISVIGATSSSLSSSLLIQNANSSASLVVLDNGIVYSNGPTFASTNTVFGNQATLLSTTGSFVTAIGYQALYSNTGLGNTAVGYQAGDGNTTGTENTYIGYIADGFSNNIGATGIGTRVSAGGFYSVAIGYAASTDGGVSIGRQSRSSAGTISIGPLSGYGSGNTNSVFIGNETAYNTNSKTGNVFIGYRAGYNENTSNKLFIANSNTTTPLIGGDFTNARLGVNINPGSTTSTLHVRGSGATSATTGLRVENTNSFPSLIVRDDGRVGIGTASPSQPFHVQHIGASGVTGSLVFYNQDNSYTSLGVTSNGVGFALSSHTNGTGYISANSSLNFTAYNSSNPSVLWMGNGSRVRFSNTAETETYIVVATSGNTLIGTSTDSGFKLDVSGSIRGTRGLTVTGSFNSYTTSSAGFLAIVSGSQPAQDIAFNFRKIGESQDGGRHTMIVEGTGAQDNNIYFGIGQAGGTKGSILCVKGNSSVNINMPLPTINYGGLAVGGWLSSYPSLLVRGFGSTGATTAMRVENTNTSASLVVLDNGFVGIGTGSAGYTLDVRGVSRIKAFLTSSAPIAIFDGDSNPYQIDAYISVGSSNGPNYAQFGTTNISPNYGGIIQWNGSSPSIAFDNNRVSIANGSMPLVALGANPPTTKASVFTVGGYNSLTNILPSEIGLQFSVLPKSLRIYGGSTTTNLAINSFGITDVQSYFYATTASNAQTVYIDGPPTVSGQLRATNFWSLYVNSGKTYLGGNTLIGTTTDSGAKLTVRGTGATSSTTTLQVENSNAAPILVVKDDISVEIGYGPNTNGRLYVGKNLAIGYVTSTANSANQSLIVGGQGNTLNQNSIALTNGGYNNTLGNAITTTHILSATSASMGSGSMIDLFGSPTGGGAGIRLQIADGTASGVNSIYYAVIGSVDLVAMRASLVGNSDMYAGTWKFAAKYYLIDGVGFFSEVSTPQEVY